MINDAMDTVRFGRKYRGLLL